MPARGAERRLVPGARVVVQQRKQVVLVRPDVPERLLLVRLDRSAAVVLEAVGREVRAEIAVVELSGEEVADRGIELRLESRDRRSRPMRSWRRR